MSGYVSGQPGHRTVFDNFIDKIGDYLPGCTLYKFGQGDEQQLLTPAAFDRSIHTPSFYNLHYNPNDALIRQINSEEENFLSVILTDGVQSDDPGQSNPPVVDAIVEWIKKGGTFGIIAFKSDFSGPFYSEHLRSWILSHGKKARFDIPSRPFYAFVLSPTRRDFLEFQERVLTDFPGTVFLFGDDSANCTVTDNASIAPYGKTDPNKSQFLWRWYKASIFAERRIVELDYLVRCKLDANFPASELNLFAETNAYSWDGNNFNPNATTPPKGSDFSFVRRPAQPPVQDFLLKLKLISDPRSSITFYRIGGIADTRSLRAEIRDLSTEDDSDPANNEKTYRLSGLMLALTSAHLKMSFSETAFPRLYLTVENK